MTPVFCRVKHSPDDGLYGDCLRACVATILNYEHNPEAVPHFAHDGATPDIVHERLCEYLSSQHGLSPWVIHYDPTVSLEEMLDVLAVNADVPFLLYGRTAYDTDHVVVCQNGKVAHDPAWYSVPLVKGGVQGSWQVVVFAKL